MVLLAKTFIKTDNPISQKPLNGYGLKIFQGELQKFISLALFTLYGQIYFGKGR